MHEDTPILLGSLGIGEGDRIQTSELFETSTRETVGFEVTFTAFVATAVLSVPPTESLLDPIGRAVGILLLGVTLIRRLTIDNQFAPQERIFYRTTRYILYLTFAGLLYVSISFSEILSQYIPIGVYVLAGLLSILFVFAFTFGYEYVFRDFMFWSAVVFYNRQVGQPHTSIYYNGLLALARFQLEMSLYDWNRDHPVVSKIYERDLGGAETTSRRWVLFIFGLLFIGLLIVAIITSFSLSLLASERLIPVLIAVIVVVLSIVPLSGVVQFVYARYGNTSFETATESMRFSWAVVLAAGLLLLHVGP